MFEVLLKRENKQEGAVLVTALIVLVVGALLIVPTLSLMTAGINAGRIVEEKTNVFYAADAGVETAILTIRNLPDSVPDGRLNGALDEGEDTDDYEFTISSVNGTVVDIVIKYYAFNNVDYYQINSIADTTAVQATVIRTAGTNLMAFQGALVSSGNISLKKDTTVIDLGISRCIRLLPKHFATCRFCLEV